MSNSRKLTIARNKAGKIEILRAGKTLILRHFECSNECIILERIYKLSIRKNKLYPILNYKRQ